MDGQTIVRTARASLTITPNHGENPLATVGILPEEITVASGQLFAFTARVLDAQGTPANGVRLEWEMQDPGAGSINHLGFFQASAQPGRYTHAIKVTAIQELGEQGFTRVAYATVTVAPKGGESPIVRLDILPQEAILASGQLFTFAAVAYDAFGSPVPGVRFQWQSDNSEAGNINSLGFFRAGDTPATYEDAVRVIATQRLGDETFRKEAFATVTVVPGHEETPLARVEVVPNEATVASGQPFSFIAVAYDAHDNPVTRVRFRWELEEDLAGTLGPSGYFRAAGDPNRYQNAVKVEAIQEVDGETLRKVAYATVTVTPALGESPLVRVEVVPKEATVVPGQNVTFTAIAHDAYDNPVPNVRFLWEVDDPAVGNISGFGRFQGKATPGHHQQAVKVRAVQQRKGAETVRVGYASVTITGPVDRVEISPSRATLGTGEGMAFTARAYDGNNVAIPGLVYTWRVLDPRAGSIDSIGTFIASDGPGEYLDAIEVEVAQDYP